ncbi:MAG: hypothetical protein ACO1RX_09170 [Candidatus Sericytochromatia bacterium]
MSDASSVSRQPQIQPQWQVRSPEAPSFRLQAAGPEAPAAPPEVYGPPAPGDSTEQLGSYARDNFEQYRFPDTERFEQQPVSERINEAIDDFKEDRPVTTAILGAGAAIASGRISADRSILDGRAEIGFSARYDDNARRTDPLTGNRHHTGQDEIKGMVTFRMPLGGN